MKNHLGYLVASLILLSACNLTKDVEVDLPSYDSQVIVEAYLIPDEQFSILLTRSDSYFNAFPTANDQFLENILVDDAEVTISYDGRTITLDNGLTFNPFTGKLQNYSANERVPEDFDGDFDLMIRLADGNTITGKTSIPAYVPLDSLVVEFNDSDTLARVLTYFEDDLNETNFYRRLFMASDSVEQDFIIDDTFNDSTTIVFGSGYDYSIGDTVTAILYHVTPDYYDFLISIETAVSANGNPFGQPSTIISNIDGEDNPIGVFSGMTLDVQELIIKE